MAFTKVLHTRAFDHRRSDDVEVPVRVRSAGSYVDLEIKGTRISLMLDESETMSLISALALANQSAAKFRQ